MNPSDAFVMQMTKTTMQMNTLQVLPSGVLFLYYYSCKSAFTHIKICLFQYKLIVDLIHYSLTTYDCSQKGFWQGLLTRNTLSKIIFSGIASRLPSAVRKVMGIQRFCRHKQIIHDVLCHTLSQHKENLCSSLLSFTLVHLSSFIDWEKYNHCHQVFKVLVKYSPQIRLCKPLKIILI